MNSDEFGVLHAAADRLALEASRDAGAGEHNEEVRYKEAYGSVLEFLISEYKKYNSDNTN